MTCVGGWQRSRARVPSPAIALDLFRTPLDRRITALALPAFGTLAAEPLYLVADTAIVGRLGTEPLAGLALAASVLLFVTALCSFLAYGTTPRVARARGAGDPSGASAVGVQALWLAVLLGLPLAAALALLARPLVQLLGGQGAALDAAVTYLRISALGLPFVLVAIVGAGVFRGVADLRTPLAIVFVASAANLVIELIAVYGLDLGIAGSAWSTVIVQVVAAAAYFGLMRRHLRAAPSARPDRQELEALLRAGSHLVVRVASLIAAFAIATAVAARVDTATIAAHQVVNTIFTLLALSLDAFAIPAQTLVAEALGAQDPVLARRVGERVLVLSVAVGVGVSIVLVALSPLLARLFTTDPAVVSRATAGLVLLALMLLPGAVAFALDGVLIGAGDVRFLGRAMVISLLIYLPFAAITLVHPSLGMVGVWGALTVWMASRAVLMNWRFRGSAWLG
ncbi:MAG TPA: MATE family efflux transporter [Acidimicrobiales bacterium]